MPTLATRSPSPTIVTDDVDLPPKLPELPDDVLKRFPSLIDWEENQNAWWARTSSAIQGNNRWVSQSVTKVNKASGDLIVSFNEFTAAITTQVDAIATEQGAQARRIVTVSAMAGLSTNYKIQNTAPVGPALNDFWTNNTDLLNPITYQWNGAAWVEVTNPISVAGVADERSARVTADGYLEGKYSLTVIAGNVVTGMNITSASGPGTNISSVIFRATDFQIYNGTLGVAMFTVSGSNVNLANTLTVSTSGKVFTGTGTYNDVNTPFYVDSSSNFSLGSKLTFNGTTLSIDGAITATTGTIGGWTIAATTLSKNNAVLDSAGQLALGTGNDIVILSATDASYRIWIGNAASGSAAFSVTKAGALSATGATISSAGTGGNLFSASSTGTRMGVSTSENFLFFNSGGDAIMNLLNNGTLYGDMQIASGYGYLSTYKPASSSIGRISGDGSIYLYNPQSDPITVVGSGYSFSVDTVGKVTTTSYVVSAGLQSSGYIRATGAANLITSGEGLELAYDTTSHFGAINAYDRTGAAFKPLYLQGSVVNLGAAQANRVNFVAGNGAAAPASTTPAAWLDVQSNGSAYKMALYT